MQIGTNLFYGRANAQMTALSDKADTLQTQIATGKRLQAPSDDVAAYSQLQHLARATADDTVFKGNVSTAQSLLQQSDSSLTTITGELQRAQTLVLQGQNGTYSDGDRQAIAQQLRGIVASMVDIANTTDARGQPLFGGQSGATAVTQAADGSVSFTDTARPPAIPVGSGQSVQATDNAAKIFGNVPVKAGGTSDVFAILNSIATALESGGDVGDALSQGSDDLNTAVSHITGAQASLGARAARLDIIANQMTTNATDRETVRSSLEDTDVTTAITELQKTMTILQATQASFTKLSGLSLFDYLK